MTERETNIQTDRQTDRQSKEALNQRKIENEKKGKLAIFFNLGIIKTIVLRQRQTGRERQTETDRCTDRDRQIGPMGSVWSSLVFSLPFLRFLRD